jgi:hypothetical protein
MEGAKAVTKQEYLREHGATLRPVTEADRTAACTDYQRSANFIITTFRGAEYYSQKGTMTDIRETLQHSREVRRKRVIVKKA